MRRHDLEARTYWAGLRTPYGWIGKKTRLPLFSNDHRQIFRYCRDTISVCWNGEGVSQIQITALDPQPASIQLDMFDTDSAASQQSSQLNRALDEINLRFGEFTLSPARLLQRSDMPNVISFGKPDVHQFT